MGHLFEEKSCYFGISDQEKGFYLQLGEIDPEAVLNFYQP
jgi:hypothetical protein